MGELFCPRLVGMLQSHLEFEEASWGREGR
jgi:hypothetical protein